MFTVILSGCQNHTATLHTNQKTDQGDVVDFCSIEWPCTGVISCAVGDAGGASKGVFIEHGVGSGATGHRGVSNIGEGLWSAIAGR